MAYRKSQLKLKHQDLSINTDIRTKKLSPQELESRPEIIRREMNSGRLVIRQLYDKATEEPLADGYGYRWIDEDGNEVPTSDIELFAVEDDAERSFSKHEPTLGGERTVTAETWIPVATIDEYLTERVYEFWGEEPIDVAQLFELAEHIRDFDEAPVIPFVLQPAMLKKWAIITPIFYDESFSMLMRVTAQKIDPENRMPVMSIEEAEAAASEDVEAPTLDQQSPFTT